MQRGSRVSGRAAGRLALALVASTTWSAAVSATVRDGFDPGVVEAATGEPARVPSPFRRQPVPGSAPVGGASSPALEEEGGEYRRWRWFWERRADHTGAMDLETRWRYFLEERPRRLASTQPAADWATLGPNTMEGIGGRMLCATFHPTHPETLYAGSNSGGLWRTRNGGASWEPITDQLPAMSVTSVAVNPSSPNEMLIGTGWGWFLTTEAYPGVGVLRSADGGATWNVTSFAFPTSAGVGTFDLAWDPVDPDRVHLAANNGYYRSSDGGITWELRKSGFCTALVIHPQKPDTVYVAFGGDGIYRSPDGGATFTPLVAGLPPGAQIYQASLAICRDQPNVLVTMPADAATFCSMGVFRSTDDGTTWSALPNAPDALTAPGLSGCYGWLFNAVSISPIDPARILIGGNRMFVTTNGGASWSQRDYYAILPSVNANAGHLYVDEFAFAWHPTVPGLVYGFNDGGAWRSIDGGSTWQARSEGLMTGLFYSVASAASRPTVLVGATQDHGLQRLDHAGGNLRWTRWTVGDGERARIDPTDDRFVYGVRDGGNRVKSVNGASTYDVFGTPINSGITEPSRWLGPIEMDPVHPNILWTASQARVYKSVNSGGSWQPSAVIPNVMTLAMDHVDPQIVYAHAYDGSTWQMWRTMNGGTSWSQLTDPSIPGWRVTDLETDPTRSGVVYATRNSGFAGQDHVKRSADFGITWTDITADLPDVTTSAIAVSAVNPAHLYLATDLGVFLSTDTGQSWHEWNDGLPLVYATDLHYLAADRSVRVATMGRGIWISRAHDVVGVGPTGEPSARSPVTVTPNPSLGALRVHFRVAVEGRTSVGVFNLTGQRVRTLADGLRAAGEHTLSWDGRDERGARVPAGVYFVRVTSSGVSRTVRAMRL